MVGAEQRPEIEQFAGESAQEQSSVTPFDALQEQGNSEVLELISILYDAYTLQQNLRRTTSEQPFEPLKSPQADQAIERFGTFPSLDPSLAERCRRASLFVEGALHIMRGSFEAYPEDSEYLRNVLNAAFAPYGFEVADGKGEIEVVHSPYHTNIEQQMERYEKSRSGTMTPYDVLHFQIDDDNLWEPVGLWGEQPDALRFAETLNMVRAVYLRTAESSKSRWKIQRSEETAENVPGLHPYFRERYYNASDILKTVEEGLLQEGREGDNYYWLHALAYECNEALYDLDMHIDVNPSWTPEQASQPLVEEPTERIVKIEEVNE